MKITINKDSTITVIPYEQTPEDYANNVSVFALIQNTLKNTKLIDYKVLSHGDTADMQISIPTSGWYTVHRVELMKKSYFLTIKDSYNKDTAYVVDDNMIQLWTRSDDDYVNVSVEEVLYTDSELVKEKEDFFYSLGIIICFLTYYKNLTSKPCVDLCNLIHQEDIMMKRKMDIVYMAMKAIEYSVERKDYITAQNILDKLNCCTGLCGSAMNTSKGCDCGC